MCLSGRTQRPELGGIIHVNRNLFFLVLVFLFFFSANPLCAGIKRVWAIDDGERVKKTNLNHHQSDGKNNPVWNGSAISLFGARNEFVAFQIILETGDAGAKGVKIVFDSLSLIGPQPYAITNQSKTRGPFTYTGKCIEMFVEHYVDIKERSKADYIWWSSVRPLPDSDYVGLVPEQLVPFEAPAGTKKHGQGGAPFDINMRSNQAVWIDIYIPKAAPTGQYKGTIRIAESGSSQKPISVNLTVHNFTLPEETHLRNGFYPERRSLADRHGLRDTSEAYWAMVRKYQMFLHRHRANLNHPASPSEFQRNLSAVYSGKYFVADSGYFGPGAGLAPNYYMIGPFDQPNHEKRPDKGYVSGFKFVSDTNAFRTIWRDSSNWWVNWFRSNSPSTVIAKYGPEEPGIENSETDTSAFPDMRRKSRWLKTNPGPGKALAYRVATNIRPDLRGVVDVWFCGGTQSGYKHTKNKWNLYPMGYVVDSARAARNRGERVGLYGGTRPSYGTEAIDAPAIDQRANCWIMWKYGIDEYWYWSINSFGERSGNPYNPWEQDWRYKSNGDGTLVYAGENKGSEPGDDRGIAGPIAGIRLKNWRRGVQDYEYLFIAHSLGIKTQDIVNTVVPAAFDHVSSYQQPPWAQRGYQYEHARQQIARLIEQKSIQKSR